MSHEELLDKAKVLATVQTLAREYYDLLRHLRLDARGYNLDRAVLINLVKRYWLDVDRLHRYHDMTRIDRHKIAGYLTYWICRLRPVSVVSNKASVNDANVSLYINEIFALGVAFGRLDVHHRIEKDGKAVSIRKGYFNALMYNLRYRPFTGDMLAMLYCLIEDQGATVGYENGVE